MLVLMDVRAVVHHLQQEFMWEEAGAGTGDGGRGTPGSGSGSGAAAGDTLTLITCMNASMPPPLDHRSRVTGGGRGGRSTTSRTITISALCETRQKKKHVSECKVLCVRSREQYATHYNDDDDTCSRESKNEAVCHHVPAWSYYCIAPTCKTKCKKKGAGDRGGESDSYSITTSKYDSSSAVRFKIDPYAILAI